MTRERTASDPRFAAALAHHRAGRIDAAAALYRAVLDSAPRHADALHLLGVAELQSGDARAAARRIGTAIGLNGAVAEYHANHALALHALGALSDAEAAGRRALALREAYPEAHNNLGTTLRDLGRTGDAVVHFKRAVALREGYGDALVNLGAALHALDRHDEAEPPLREAVARDPGNPVPLGHLGVLLKDTGRLAEAEVELATALRLAPRDAEAMVNLALLREAQGRDGEAEALYRAALATDPARPLAAWNLSLLRLRHGDLGEGLALYDARLGVRDTPPPDWSPVPPWRGEDLSGRHLFVWREQGLGDELLFGTCLPDLLAVAGRLTVACDPRLVGLFSRALPGASVRAAGTVRRAPEGADVHAAMGSLPRFLRPSLARFPARAGWLSADPVRRAEWRRRVDALGPGLKVGIGWRSRHMTGVRRHAYTTLDQWAAVFAVPGVVFVNLQYDARDDEIAAAAARFGVTVHRWADTDLAGDLEAAAALTASLDLVLSVASSVGEMAGALGVPVWRIMGGADWTALGTRCRPWFPGMRLLTAGTGGGLTGALGHAARELRRLVPPPTPAGGRTGKTGGEAGKKGHAMGRSARDILQRALECHRAGDLAAAEALYRTALDREPRTADALHLLGVVHHQTGRNDEAAALIRKAIAINGRNAEYHANLGLALQGMGRPEDAVAALGEAVRLQPAYPQGHHNLGVALTGLGRLEEAARHYAEAVRLRPDFAEAHMNLGAALQDLGRLEEAVPHHRRAAELRPDDPAPLNTLAVAMRRLGRLGEAIAWHQAALARRPDDPDLIGNLAGAFQAAGLLEHAADAFAEALRRDARNPGHLNNFGLVMQGLGRLDAAAECFQAALAVRPDYAEAHDHLGSLAALRGRPGEAARHHREAIARRPGMAAAWNNLGNALKGLGHPDAAIACWWVALALAPAAPDFLSNLGNGLCDAERFTEAIAAQRRSLRLHPANAAAWNNLGDAVRLQRGAVDAGACHARALALDPAYAEAASNLGLAEQRAGRPVAAERWFDRALALVPELARARFNRGLLRLERGRLADGWPDYAWRFASGRIGPARQPALPAWRGEDLAGRRLLVWREQGVGDEIMFASCYGDAIARAGHVVIDCDPRLRGLFARSFPAATVRPESLAAGRGETGDLAGCDLHTPAGTLARVFRSGLADFPARRSWLTPDPGRMAVWVERLAALGPGLRVGVAWRSQLMTAERRPAYLPLDRWGPLFAVPGVLPVLLQYGDVEAELGTAECRFATRIHRWSDLDLKDDFEGTAALAANLDLVIAPAVSAAELAGALGVPVWRLGGTDWTQLGTAIRPWYPSHGLNPPPAGGSLAEALARAVRRLRKLTAG